LSNPLAHPIASVACNPVDNRWQWKLWNVWFKGLLRCMPLCREPDRDWWDMGLWLVAMIVKCCE
jgi:hypothetical protein